VNVYVGDAVFSVTLTYHPSDSGGVIVIGGGPSEMVLFGSTTVRPTLKFAPVKYSGI
jgi:hypothetical protein